MTKFLEVLKSRNFAINFIAIITAVLGFNNIELGYTPESLYDLLADKNLTEVLLFIVINMYGVISKILSKILNKEFKWSFLQDSNFLTLVISLISIVTSFILGNIVSGIVISSITIILNIVFHVSLPTKANN